VPARSPSPRVESYVSFLAAVRDEIAQGRPGTYLSEIDELARDARRAARRKPREARITVSVVASFPLGGQVGAQREVNLLRPLAWTLR
jgi:hypothetical protein